MTLFDEKTDRSYNYVGLKATRITFPSNRKETKFRKYRNQVYPNVDLLILKQKFPQLKLRFVVLVVEKSLLKWFRSINFCNSNVINFPFVDK